MPITVNSPYSGRPVKVRDQDVGRSVRDEDGRVFYVVPRASGAGFYAALTRNGSERDEQRYDALLEKLERSEAVSPPMRQPVRDARGRRRRRPVAVLVVIVLVLAAGLAYALIHRQNTGGWPLLPPPESPAEFPAGGDTRAPDPPGPPAPPLDRAPEAPPEAPTADPSGAVAPPRDAREGDVPPGEAPSPPAAPDEASASEAPARAVPRGADASGVDAVAARGGADVSRASSSSGGGDPVVLGHTAASGREPVAGGGALSRAGRFVRLPSGGMHRRDRPGEGAPAAEGQYVELRYREKAHDESGPLADRPWRDESFVLSGEGPAEGWRAGVAGMRVGERRTVLTPRSAASGPLRYDVAEVELRALRPGLTWRTELNGDGPEAERGDTVGVHYIAYVRGDAAPFANTHGAEGPVRFTLGGGEVIEGLELGVSGMRVGEVRSLVLPPHLAYGSKSIGEAIPAGSTLVFVVELMEVR